MIVSAYDKNDKIVEGKLVTSPTGNKLVLTESGYVNLKRLNHVRFVEESDDPVQDKVSSDLANVPAEKLATKKEEEIQQAGKDREKELTDAGMKIEKDEYATKFTIAATAKASEADADSNFDANAADAKNSETIKGLSESIDDEVLNNNLHPDYQDVPLYDDDRTRDQIYIDLSNEIDSYGKETKKFDDKELTEHLCNKYLNGFQIHKETFKESISSVYNLCVLKEFTTAKFVDAVKDGKLESIRNKFIRLFDKGSEKYVPDDKLKFIDDLISKLQSQGYSSAEIFEILGDWFGIGGTYEFDMNVINKMVKARENNDTILDDHPNWFPQNDENVWNNGTNIEQDFSYA